MLIQTGGFEIFLDENLLLSQNAHNAGVTVTQTVYDGMPHDFALLLPELNESVNSFIEIENFINQYMP